MTRLIDMDAFRETLCITGTADTCKGCTYCDNLIGFACNTYKAPSFAYVCEAIDDAPTVDAVPVEFIKGELERLRANRIDADSDDVDYAWDLKMKIEALSDLLGAWEDTYEID